MFSEKRLRNELREAISLLVKEVGYLELTEDTAPDVIAARHRALVEAAVAEYGVDIDRIVDDLILPVSIVQRHLTDMGLLTILEEKRATANSVLADVITEYLRRSDIPMTPRVIRDRTGADYDAIYRVLSRSNRFEQVVIGKVGIRTQHAWKLREGK